MYTKANKKMSRTFLYAIVAAFILICPSFLDAAGLVGMYALFAVMAGTMTWRIYENKKIMVTRSFKVISALAVANAAGALWCKNPEGQLKGFIMIMTMLLTVALSADYFDEIGENADRRLMYLFSMSGFILSAINISEWLMNMVPLGEYSAFSAGTGQNDALGAFMAVSVIFCFALAKQTAKSRKIILYTMAVPMVFVLLMARSVCAIIFMLSLLIAVKNKKGSKRAAAISIILMVFCALIFIFSDYREAVDAFLTGFKRPFGLGAGGYIASQEEFISTYYEKVKFLPLFALISADFGIFGIVLCIFLITRYALLIKKNIQPKSISALCVLLFLLFMPFENEYTVLILSAGFLTYAEADFFVTLSMDKKKRMYAINSLSVLMLVSVLLSCHASVRKKADYEYEKGNYTAAYEAYSDSAVMNIFDSESVRKALVCLRKGEITDVSDKKVQSLMNAMQLRSRKSVASYVEKARFYGYAGDYVNAADNWRKVLIKAPFNHEYRVSFVKLLYKAIREGEKGSPETRKLYEEITSISETTDNLDAKKAINDIRDKALVYTKSELFLVERE